MAELTMREIGQRGGAAARDTSTVAQRRRRARENGLKVSNQRGSAYMAEIGRKGGLKSPKTTEKIDELNGHG